MAASASAAARLESAPCFLRLCVTVCVSRPFLQLCRHHCSVPRRPWPHSCCQHADEQKLLQLYCVSSQLRNPSCPAACLSQVLAQLHGVPAEEDEQHEQQEDVQPIMRSQEHRRPRSAGHPAEAASSSAPHKIGRPPLAETTANNKLGLKVCSSSLLAWLLGCEHAVVCSCLVASVLVKAGCFHD